MSMKIKIGNEEKNQLVNSPKEAKKIRLPNTSDKSNESLNYVKLPISDNSVTVDASDAEKYAKVIKGKHVCCICQHECLTLKGFRQHIKCHGGMTVYSCPEVLCTKFFKTHYKLKRHFVTHAMERPFACHDCDRSYKRADKLSEHRRQHNHFSEGPCTAKISSSSSSSSFFPKSKNKTSKAHNATQASKISINTIKEEMPVKKSLRIEIMRKKMADRRGKSNEI